MSESDLVSLTLDKDNLVAVVQVNRPNSMNALNEDVLLGLDEVFNRLNKFCHGELAYQSCRSVLLKGAGEKAFVAGADIKLMHNASREQLSRFISLGQRVMRRIETTPLPVIAQVQGFAIGGGLELALACDLIVASDKALLGQAEINLGLIPGFGGTQRLTERVGPAVAKRLIFSGENISASECLRLGIVDFVVSPEELSAKAEMICKGFAHRSPLAVSAAKRCISQYSAVQRLAGLTNEVEEFIQLFSSTDAKEGIAAFVEKRKPTFVGK